MKENPAACRISVALGCSYPTWSRNFLLLTERGSKKSRLVAYFAYNQKSLWIQLWPCVWLELQESKVTKPHIYGDHVGLQVIEILNTWLLLPSCNINPDVLRTMPSMAQALSALLLCHEMWLPSSRLPYGHNVITVAPDITHSRQEKGESGQGAKWHSWVNFL